MDVEEPSPLWVCCERSTAPVRQLLAVLAEADVCAYEVAKLDDEELCEEAEEGAEEEVQRILP